MPPTCKTGKGFRQGSACIEKVGENFARLFGRERFRWKWWFVDFSIPRKAIMDEIKMAVEQPGEGGSERGAATVGEAVGVEIQWRVVGATEFLVRDGAHRIGLRLWEAALEGWKKWGLAGRT